MSVKIRSGKFHYRFMVAGISYSGICNGCEIPRDASVREIAAIRKRAEQIEAAERARIIREKEELKEVDRDVRRNKTVIALVENYKYELTGGHPVRLDEAFELVAQKPSRRVSRSSYAGLKRTYWRDFCAYMAYSYPDLTDISHVRRIHCEAYVKYLTDHGRFQKEIRYTIPHGHSCKEISYCSHYKISAKTIKEIVCVCRGIFSRLMEDAGLIVNPWDGVVLPEADSMPRKIYTPEEIARIADGISEDPERMQNVYQGDSEQFDIWCRHAHFCRPLFLIGASGWPEVDICTMTWDNVDWKARAIMRNRSKTGAGMVLFFTPGIERLLRTQPQDSQYVFPEHAEMYLRHSGSVSYRVIKFLTGLGITTSIKVPERRAASVKDHHSLRHTYCTEANKARIPVNIRMKLAGHKTVMMAEHYANHCNLEELREAARRLPTLLPAEINGTCPSAPRNKLADMAYTLPSETIDYILALICQAKSS